MSPDIDVAWQDRRSSWRGERAVTLRVVSISRLGIDERRATNVGTNLRERVFGNRLLRVQMIVDTNDQDLEDSAQEQADFLVAGFSRSDVELLLLQECLGVPNAGPVLVTNAPDAHGDERSIAIVDLVFPWSRTAVGGVVPRIDNIELSSSAGIPPVIPFTVSRGP